MHIKIGNIISKADLLGLTYKLRYKGSSAYKTCLGGFLTVILVAVTTVATIFFGREVVERKSPIITASQALAENSQLTLKQLGFHFMLADADGTVLHLDPVFMKGVRVNPATIHFGFENNAPIISFDGLIVEPCREEFFEPDYWAVRSAEIQMSTFLCLNTDKFYRDNKLVEEPVTIRNAYSQLHSSTLRLNLQLCDKKADPDCDEWLQVGKDFFIQTNFAEYFFDGSKESPLQVTTKTIITLVGSTFNFIENVSLIGTSAVSDEGFLFENSDEFTFHSFKEKKMNTQIFDPIIPNIYDMTVDIPRLTNTINRRYMKLQEVLANVGGFIKAVFILFNLFTHFMAEFWFFKEFREEFLLVNKTQIHAETKPMTVIRLNNSAVDLNQRKKQFKQKKISLLNYAYSLFSREFAVKHQLDKERIYKYFDIKHLMFSQIEQERLLNQVKSNAT